MCLNVDVIAFMCLVWFSKLQEDSSDKSCLSYMGDAKSQQSYNSRQAF